MTIIHHRCVAVAVSTIMLVTTSVASVAQAQETQAGSEATVSVCTDDHAATRTVAEKLDTSDAKLVVVGADKAKISGNQIDITLGSADVLSLAGALGFTEMEQVETMGVDYKTRVVNVDGYLIDNALVSFKDGYKGAIIDFGSGTPENPVYIDFVSTDGSQQKVTMMMRVSPEGATSGCVNTDGRDPEREKDVTVVELGSGSSDTLKTGASLLSSAANRYISSDNNVVPSPLLNGFVAAIAVIGVVATGAIMAIIGAIVNFAQTHMR